MKKGTKSMKEPLLDEDTRVAGSRPPPFAPGTYDGQYDDGEEVDMPSARVREVERGAARGERRNAGQQQVVIEGGSGRETHTHIVHSSSPPPQIVIIRERVHDDGVCCPLLTFIFGFSFPLIWLLGFCQTSSNNPNARFLARCSIIAFVFTAIASSGIIFGDWAKDGKWPWEKGCFFPWDKKC